MSKEVELTEENKALLSILEFRYSMGISLDHGAERVYTCEYKGLKFQRNLWTPRNRASGNWGTGKSTFSFTYEKVEYTDLNQFLNEVRNRILKVTP